MISHSATKLLSALAAAALVGMVGFNALAQEKAEKKTPAAKTTEKTDKKATKTPSACKGIEETACKGKSAECSWIAAGKTAAGKDRKAYCRSKPKPKAKTEKSEK